MTQEDEKIRKALIRFHLSTIDIDGIKGEKILAWLEKQGEKSDPRYENLEELLAADDIYQMAMNDEMVQEAKEKAVNALSEMCIGKLLEVEIQAEQKPADKVEPKFKVGDWVVSELCGVVQIKAVVQIKPINSNYYELENTMRFNIDYVDKCWHSWTIQDAKDGDVLAVNGKPFIYYHTDEYNGNYCCIDDKGCFRTNIRFSFEGNCILPATKEQQELLFEKMKEAGYEWDEEKKELRKIEQSELTEFEDAVKDMMNTYRDAIGDNDVTTEEVKKHAAYLLSLIPYKSAEWTDEDECYMGECISAIATKDSWSFEEKRKTKHWLKSLKQRMEK